MGQYYKIIILGDTKKNNKEIILLTMIPWDYKVGNKLMEHSYVDTSLLNTVEFLISEKGPFYKSRIVWAGDYADDEEGYDNEEQISNLYNLAENYSPYNNIYYKNNENKYIVNHTKQLYTKIESFDNNTEHIHPLPLLVAEGNGKGGGDYNGSNKILCGTWARDFISVEKEIPDNYNEIICDFQE